MIHVFAHISSAAAKQRIHQACESRGLLLTHFTDVKLLSAFTRKLSSDREGVVIIEGEEQLTGAGFGSNTKLLLQVKKEPSKNAPQFLNSPQESEEVIRFEASENDLSSGFCDIFFSLAAQRSQLGKIEKELKLMREKCEDNAYQKDAFVHENRNALQALSARCKKLTKQLHLGSKDDPWMQELFESTKKIAVINERLISLTQDIATHDFSPNTYNENPLPASQLSDVNIQMVVNLVIDEIQSCLEMGKIEFDVEISDNLKARASKNHLEQVLFNLVKNSVEAIVDSESPKIQILGKQIKNSIIIQVIDSGAGIENPNIIFEKYQSTKKGKGGSGLGLHLSQKLIQKMGGKLYYQLAEGNHTSFIIEFSPQH